MSETRWKSGFVEKLTPPPPCERSWRCIPSTCWKLWVCLQEPLINVINDGRNEIFLVYNNLSTPKQPPIPDHDDPAHNAHPCPKCLGQSSFERLGLRWLDFHRWVSPLVRFSIQDLDVLASVISRLLYQRSFEVGQAVLAWRGGQGAYTSRPGVVRASGEETGVRRGRVGGAACCTGAGKR